MGPDFQLGEKALENKKVNKQEFHVAIDALETMKQSGGERPGMGAALE